MTDAIVKFREEKGMLLPFTPLSITFENIRYSVDMPKGVSGAFKPGVLTTLMGVSGAGKTMLLDILAGRKNTGYAIARNKNPLLEFLDTMNKMTSTSRSSRSTSPYYSRLGFSYLQRSNLRPDWQIFFEEVMELIALTPMRNALVGFPNAKGLSIEQRKRLTVAAELVANPSIIFMDEPTMGLDSRAAAIVVRTVRNIMDTGRTVVCMVYQLSIKIFEALDELFLLSQGGEEIYVGPLGNKSLHMINYFEQINGVRKIEDGYNPATWVMGVTTQVEEELLGVKFADVYRNSLFLKRLEQGLEERNPTLQSRALEALSRTLTCLSKKAPTRFRRGERKKTGHVSATFRHVICHISATCQSVRHALAASATSAHPADQSTCRRSDPVLLS
ncbi:hypothetical protein HYC85_026208 [Camellia sinensis]|uniref:ABC transporter domain-containing protein n=1 Tax=Camellia sinensis TaxID=4442 RepID=A0A7J7G315_CAMSI|nr:hypothetical protein HYC85_026208 [Camellia sinensis]